jgi:hypothetical protein
MNSVVSVLAGQWRKQEDTNAWLRRISSILEGQVAPLTPLNADGSSGLRQGTFGLVFPRSLADQIADKLTPGSLNLKFDLTPVTAALKKIEELLMHTIWPSIGNVTAALSHQNSMSLTLVNIEVVLRDIRTDLGKLGGNFGQLPQVAYAGIPTANVSGVGAGGDTYVLNIDGADVASDDNVKDIFNRASQIYRAKGIRHRRGVK